MRLFEEKRCREMRRKNIIGQVCDTPKSYDNVMHVGLRKVAFKWQRGNKIGEKLAPAARVQGLCGIGPAGGPGPGVGSRAQDRKGRCGSSCGRVLRSPSEVRGQLSQGCLLVLVWLPAWSDGRSPARTCLVPVRVCGPLEKLIRLSIPVAKGQVRVEDLRVSRGLRFLPQADGGRSPTASHELDIVSLVVIPKPVP